MLIKTAGYMWHRQYVDWGQRRLVGSPEKSDSDEVEFANQSAIYGLPSMSD